MIDVSLSTALWLPVVFTLSGLFVLWLFYAFRRRRSEGIFQGPRVFHCANCRHVYVGKKDLPMWACPRCNTFNEAVRI